MAHHGRQRFLDVSHAGVGAGQAGIGLVEASDELDAGFIELAKQLCSMLIDLPLEPGDGTLDMLTLLLESLVRTIQPLVRSVEPVVRFLNASTNLLEKFDGQFAHGGPWSLACERNTPLRSSRRIRSIEPHSRLLAR